jgi:hypothetical protein
MCSLLVRSSAAGYGSDCEKRLEFVCLKSAAETSEKTPARYSNHSSMSRLLQFYLHAFGKFSRENSELPPTRPETCFQLAYQFLASTDNVIVSQNISFRVLLRVHVSAECNSAIVHWGAFSRGRCQNGGVVRRSTETRV